MSTRSVLGAIPAPTLDGDERERLSQVSTDGDDEPIWNPRWCGQCGATKREHVGRNHEWRPADEATQQHINAIPARAAAEREAEAHKYDGWLNVASIDRLPAPVPMVDPFLALREGEAAILYGEGGSTKGTTACLWIIAVLRDDADARVLILDYENHEQEWKSRLSRMGAAEDEQARVYWVSPYSPRWTGPHGTFGEVAEYVRDGCDRLGITFLVLDSMSAALASSEAMGGIGASQEWGMALAKIGRRSLSLGHIAGGSEKWPRKPFGSVHFRNMARETWAIGIVESGQDYRLPTGLVGTFTRVELRCTKASDRMPPRDHVITYAYGGDADIYAVSSPKAATATGDRVAMVLGSNGGKAMSTADIVKALKEEYDEAVTSGQLYDLMRNDRAKRFVQAEGSRPRPWSLATSGKADQ